MTRMIDKIERFVENETDVRSNSHYILLSSMMESNFDK